MPTVYFVLQIDIFFYKCNMYVTGYEQSVINKWITSIIHQSEFIFFLNVANWCCYKNNKIWDFYSCPERPYKTEAWYLKIQLICAEPTLISKSNLGGLWSANHLHSRHVQPNVSCDDESFAPWLEVFYFVGSSETRRFKNNLILLRLYWHTKVLYSL